MYHVLYALYLEKKYIYIYMYTLCSDPVTWPLGALANIWSFGAHDQVQTAAQHANGPQRLQRPERADLSLEAIAAPNLPGSPIPLKKGTCHKYFGYGDRYIYKQIEIKI